MLGCEGDPPPKQPAWECSKFSIASAPISTRLPKCAWTRNKEAARPEVQQWPRQTDRQTHAVPALGPQPGTVTANKSGPSQLTKSYGCLVTRAYGWLFGITAMNSIRQKTALKLLFPLDLLFKGKKKANPLRQPENQTYSSEVLQNLRTQTASLYINTNHCTQNSFFFF